MSDPVATFPLTGHLSIVRKFIEKERTARNLSLKGAVRQKAVEEAMQALESLKVIEQKVRQA